MKEAYKILFRHDKKQMLYLVKCKTKPVSKMKSTNHERFLNCFLLSKESTKLQVT